jgi:hypothetical protein
MAGIHRANQHKVTGLWEAMISHYGVAYLRELYESTRAYQVKIT